MHPFFSIIIPVYNVAPYLRECLDSVLAQTFADWEAICVDDGSTDGSGTILDEYGRKDERFKIVHISNVGVSCARNTGLDRSRGSYVTFMDGDDLILPTWLESFFEVITATHADLVRQKEKAFSGNCDSKVDLSRSKGIARYDSAKVLEWGYETYCYKGWSWLNAIRRNCIDKGDAIKFPPGMRFMEDNIFMLRVVREVKSAVQTSFSGYLYRQHRESVCAHLRESEMIVRFFSEASMLVLQRPLPDICLIHVGQMLVRSLVDWRKYRDKLDRSGEKLVMQYVGKAVSSGMIRIKEVSPKWRLGIYCAGVFRTWLLLDTMLLVQRVWGIILRIAKFRKRHSLYSRAI